MVLLNLDRNSETPLFRQVFIQLKDKIDNDILKPGDKLPPTRAFIKHTRNSGHSVTLKAAPGHIH